MLKAHDAARPRPRGVAFSLTLPAWLGLSTPSTTGCRNAREKSASGCLLLRLRRCSGGGGGCVHGLAPDPRALWCVGRRRRGGSEWRQWETTSQQLWYGCACPSVFFPGNQAWVGGDDVSCFPFFPPWVCPPPARTPKPHGACGSQEDGQKVEPRAAARRRLCGRGNAPWTTPCTSRGLRLPIAEVEVGHGPAKGGGRV